MPESVRVEPNIDPLLGVADTAVTIAIWIRVFEDR